MSEYGGGGETVAINFGSPFNDMNFRFASFILKTDTYAQKKEGTNARTRPGGKKLLSKRPKEKTPGKYIEKTAEKKKKKKANRPTLTDYSPEKDFTGRTGFGYVCCSRIQCCTPRNKCCH